MTKSDPKLVARLARIEGQVRGVARMIAEGRGCADVLAQLQAVKSALRKVEEQVLKTHLDRAASEALAAGDHAAARKQLEALVELLGRYGR